MEEIERVVIVTGSESGIGLAVTQLLLESGCHVVGADISNRNNPHEDHPRFSFIPTDVTIDDEIDGLFAAVLHRFGRLDVLFNCAGITSLDPISAITSESWDSMFAVNLKAVFFCSKRALEIMERQGFGRIINVASNAGKSGGKAVGAHYSASKAGVICLTRSMAMHAAEYNITVNCVAPGPTSTPMTAGWDKEVQRSLVDKIPLGRFAEPVEVAEAIVFLASEAARYITGETLNVNGGLLMD